MTNYKANLESGYAKKANNIKYPEKEKEFMQLLNNSNEDDNPIIMIVHLKER